MHHPRTALYLAARPLLVVVGVQALRVRRRESRYAREPRLASLRIAAVLRQRPSSTAARHVLYDGHGGGVAPAERP